MSFKVGQRVIVLPLAEGHSPHVGKKGEIEAISADGKSFLVDDQLVQGVRVGSCTMREWLTSEEIDHG